MHSQNHFGADVSSDMGLCWHGMMSDGEGQKKHHMNMMPSRLLESITWQY